MTLYANPHCRKCGGTFYVIARQFHHDPDAANGGHWYEQDYACPECIVWNETGGAMTEYGIDDAMLVEVGVPLRYASHSFDAIDAKIDRLHTLENCKRYVKALGNRQGERAFGRQTSVARKNGLCLWGAPGASKTTFAVCVMRALMQAGYTCQWTSHIGLMESLRPRSSDDYTPQQVKDALILADVLVIDDLGKAKDTAFSMQELMTIMEQRYANMLPTIITTNHHPDKLADKVGEAIASRIAGQCAFRPEPKQ